MKPRITQGIRTAILFAMDALLIYLLFLWGCFASQDYEIFSPSYAPLLLVGLGWAITLSTVFLLTKTYRIAMNRIGLYESMRIILIAMSVDVTFYLILFVTQSIEVLRVPWVLKWTVFALMVAVHVFACVALRFLPRIVRSIRARLHRGKSGTRTLLVGAGDAAKLLIDSNRLADSESRRVFVGALDDDRFKLGTVVDGVTVLGTVADAPKFIKKLDVEEVLIAIPSLSEEKLRAIVEALSSFDVRIRKMPAYQGDLDRVNEIRVVDISYSDLLGRPCFETHADRVGAKFSGKTVLVTGGGGSIGGEIALRLLKLGADKVILFDQYENGVTDVFSRAKDAIRNLSLDGHVRIYLGSVRDEIAVKDVFSHWHPDYVFHCAAVKHVPLAEDYPVEAVATNVIGTDLVCSFAVEYGTKEVYFLSTDKVIQPDSVMSRTKRLGEVACSYYAAKGSTAFRVMRFGNVLASKGSVVPIFTKQIEAGGPVTVTSEDASRYFFTLEDCCDLILEAATIEGERPIYDLETGQSTSILSLAAALIRQAGYIPYKDIDIVITGLRHGEATPKDAPYDRAKQQPTSNPRIYTEGEPCSFDYEKVYSTLVGLTTPEEIKDYLSTLDFGA